MDLDYSKIIESVLAALIGGGIIFILSSILTLRRNQRKLLRDIDHAFDKIRRYHPEEQRNGGRRRDELDKNRN